MSLWMVFYAVGSKESHHCCVTGGLNCVSAIEGVVRERHIQEVSLHGFAEGVHLQLHKKTLLSYLLESSSM